MEKGGRSLEKGSAEGTTQCSHNTTPGYTHDSHSGKQSGSSSKRRVQSWQIIQQFPSRVYIQRNRTTSVQNLCAHVHSNTKPWKRPTVHQLIETNCGPSMRWNTTHPQRGTEGRHALRHGWALKAPCRVKEASDMLRSPFL